MPFVEATLSEIQREGSIAPLSVQHLTLENVHVEDYIIPKDSAVVPDLMHILHEPKHFEKPY